MDTSITEKLHEARLRVGYAITELGSMIAMWIMGSRRTESRWLRATLRCQVDIVIIGHSKAGVTVKRA